MLWVEVFCVVEVLPPQDTLARLMPAHMKASAAILRVIRLRCPLPMNAKAAIPKGSIQPAEIGMGFLCWGKFIPKREAGEMVRVEVAVPEPGVMVTGEKEQVRVLGIPLQESEMGLLKDPDCGLALTVRLPAFPAGMVTEEGDALKDTVDDPAPEEHTGL